jgi:hypothetical protein
MSGHALLHGSSFAPVPAAASGTYFRAISRCTLPDKRRIMFRVKYWENIADNLKKRGWRLGWVSAVDSEGRTIWIVDAHRDKGKRFVVRSDEKLAALLELERITHELALSALLGDDTH